MCPHIGVIDRTADNVENTGSLPTAPLKVLNDAAYHLIFLPYDLVIFRIIAPLIGFVRRQRETIKHHTQTREFCMEPVNQSCQAIYLIDPRPASHPDSDPH